MNYGHTIERTSKAKRVQKRTILCLAPFPRGMIVSFVFRTYVLYCAIAIAVAITIGITIAAAESRHDVSSYRLRSILAMEYLQRNKKRNE